MNEGSAAATGTTVPLAEFPVVLLSYDEPWAEEAWSALRALRPNALRVHGVKGLNACHVAASEAADADWFLTVDADTRMLDSARDLRVPEALLTPSLRLDWQSRNAVNGLVSGNGSLKLWPRELVGKMRSHEAAPRGRVSLDADIGEIAPGTSRVVLMQGCHSVCDPAQTPFHAFRSGFRETTFLAHLHALHEDRDLGAESPLGQLLTVWCTVGRHAEFGDWLLYGARMGLWAVLTWRDWDIRKTHDYAWLDWFWRNRVLPRIGPGGAVSELDGHKFDADRLREEVAHLAMQLADLTELPICDLDPEASRLMAEADVYSSGRSPDYLDALGRAYQMGKGLPKDAEAARARYEEAAALGHVSALTNLGRLHQLGLLADADKDTAAAFYRLAIERGCAYAPYHLAHLMQETGGRSHDHAAAERLLDLAAERGFAPAGDSAP